MPHGAKADGQQDVARVHRDRPEALESLRERYADWQVRLDRDGISPWVAAAVRFAVDGIWLADVLGLAPVTGRRRSQVIAVLEKLVHDAGRPLSGKT